MADNFTTFEAFLSSLNFAEEYLQRFKDSGFDDIDLIKSLDAEEKQQMFELVGLSKKPGHLLKFKKGLCSLETPSMIPISHEPVESLRDKTTTAATSQSASFIKQGRKTQRSKWLLDLTFIYNFVTGSLVLINFYNRYPFKFPWGRMINLECVYVFL
jgi:hypothetical protein